MQQNENTKQNIVVTYSQFDSNIRVFYVFLGFLKNTWKYFFLSTFEKYSYFVCHYYETKDKLKLNQEWSWKDSSYGMSCPYIKFKTEI